jgi:hypothetical protein
MMFGPSATEADASRMPPPETATQYTNVRTARWATTQLASMSSERRTLVVDHSGVIEVKAAYMSVELGPGDVLFVDDVAPSQYTANPLDESCVLLIGVADSWSPRGVVVPDVDDTQGRSATPLLREIYVADEQSHFRGFEQLFPSSPGESEPQQPRSVSFLCLSPESFGDWHTESSANLVCVLGGTFELEVGGASGSVEGFRVGDVCLADDRSGQGHISRTHGETRFVAVSLPEDHVWKHRG